MAISQKEQGIRRRIGTDKLIGQYNIDDNGNYIFSDIRGEEGDRVELPGVEDLRIGYAQECLKLGSFYSFDWHLVEDDIVVDGTPMLVDNDEFLRRLYGARLRLSGNNLELAINFQNTIFDEVTGAQHTYIYELLQNANDYPYNGEKVNVNFILSKHYLFFTHTGAAFNLPNVVGITSINQGEKKKNTETIGYKGIGFKTVFVNNEYVYLKSADWSFRFDKQYSELQFAGKCPWALMPIPTEETELDQEIKTVFDSLRDDMRVRFALKHKTDASLNLPQLKKVFEDNQILLFIPNVASVDVIYEGKTIYSIKKDEDHWIVSDFTYVVPEGLKKWVAENVNSGNKVPEKFKEIANVKISFAVAQDNGVLKPVKGARVYNYLPTELRLGFEFLINADFIPNGSRSGLHDVEWNNHIMSQAGVLFADWWTGFMKNEGEYDLQSVFSILPDLKNTLNPYASLFVKGFLKRIKEIPCIPTLRNGEYRLRKISDVIIDTINFFKGDDPIMTDDEFYGFCNTNLTLVHPAIRYDNNCARLFEAFKQTLQNANRFNGLYLDKLVYSSSFSQWLLNAENNIKFNSYLIETGFIDNMRERAIFLRSDGHLGIAGKIYADIDCYADDLDFIKDLLPRLDSAVKMKLEKCSNWPKYTRLFKPFDTNKFSRDILENFGKYAPWFIGQDESIKFIHFLGVTHYQGGLPDKYPFYDDAGNLIYRRENLYLKDVLGEKFHSREWILDDWIHFIHPDYIAKDEERIVKFLKNRNINYLSSEQCYRNFIANKERISWIANAIKDETISKDFYNYLWQNTNSDFTPDMRNNYTILVTDGVNEDWITINNVIFRQDEEWKKQSSQPWMPEKCCWAISNIYFDGLSDNEREEFSTFIGKRYIVQNCTIGGLFSSFTNGKVFDRIFESITTFEESKEFLSFLWEYNNSTYKSLSTPEFKKFPVRIIGESELHPIKDYEGRLFIYNDELNSLYNQPWFDKESIAIIDPEYAEVFENKDRCTFFGNMGFGKFDLLSYVRNKLLPNLNNIKDEICTKEANLSFHHFFASIHTKLSKEESELLQQMPIFISSPDIDEGILVDSSSNHYLPSDLLTEIIAQDIVPIEILDSIHPDYITNNQDVIYLQDTLENASISKDGFIHYIVDKASDINSYLSDFSRNVRFWQWVINTKVDKDQLKQLEVFYLISDSGELLSPSALYTSNEYSEAGTKEFTLRFVSGAKFVSNVYYEADDEADWSALFKNIGVNTSTKDILFKDVIPNLSTITDDSIILELAKNITSVKIRLENKDRKFYDQLADLRLLCLDGVYRKIKDSLISGLYYDIEIGKYPDIIITNLVSNKYIELCGENNNLRRQVLEFMKLIGDTYQCRCENATQLRKKKIEYFASHQSLYLSSDAHYRIITELASDYNEDYIGIKGLLQEFGGIKLLDDFGKLHDPKTLYLSSVYNPICDFQGHGVTGIYYVNNKYREFGNYFSGLFRTLGVKDTFREENIPLLANEDFAVYFWTQYADAHKSEVEGFCDYDHLHTVRCIPSFDGVKKPVELYHTSNPRLNKIIEQLPDGHLKQPRINLPSWVNLGLNRRLYIEDCLDYLTIETLDYRQDVLSWIVETPDNVVAMNRDRIMQFFDNATWYTGGKDWRPLNGLVALEWSDGRSPLKDNFGGNSFVCNPSNMPETKQNYDRLCSILGIRILTEKDFQKQKAGKCSPDPVAKHEIDKRLLYIAYQIDKEKWQEIYADFHKHLNAVDLAQCEKIRYFFNDNITSDKIYSYIDDPNKLWYVGAWDGKRFGRIIEWLLNTFQLKKHNFSYSSLEDLFEGSLNDYLQSHEGGAMPKEFLALLEESDKTGVRVDNNAEYEEGIGEEDNGELSPDIINQGEEARTKRRTLEKATHRTNVTEVNSEREVSTESNYNAMTETSKSSEVKEEGKAGSVPRQQSMPRQGRHSTDNISTQREKQRLVGPSSSAAPENVSSIEDKMKQKWESQRKKGVQRAKGSGYIPTEMVDMDIDLKSKTSNTPENPGFFTDKSTPSTTSSSFRDRSSEEISRRRTEAQKIAENAQEQLDLYEIWQQSEPYTFKWFKYLMELQFQDKDKKLPTPVQIDFHAWMAIDEKQKVLRVIEPSRNIPKWLEDAQDVVVTLLGKSSRRLYCSVLSVDGDGIELLINPDDYPVINSFEKIRINAQNHTNFIDSLQTSFLELDYDDDIKMDDTLPDNISFIYGPPGTGKTTRLVAILSDLLAKTEMSKKSLNILILTPTNKASDVIAEKLFDDSRCHDSLVRFGYSDSTKLLSDDSCCFQNRDTMDLNDRNDNIMVTTIARYAYDTIQPDSTPICEVKWDYIIVDEASMIDIVPITYLLHKGRGAEFIIAGDPKQITPIPQHNMPAYNIYDMVKLDSFKDAMSGNTRFPVECLTTQHRSIPVIGDLVSNFCYEGLVNNDLNRVPAKPLNLDNMNIKPINFLGFKVEEMDMLYELSQINESAFHLYSAIFTYNMVNYTVDQIKQKYKEHYSIGIVCPYKSQADAIQQMFENRPISSSQCEVICGTVHKFQGDECDIMFLVLNPPPKTYSGSHINNTNIINVAMSRARDYIFFVMPEKDIDGYHIKDRLGQLIKNQDRSIHFCGDIEKLIFGDSDYIYNNTSIQCHQPVNVFYDNRAKYEIRLSDTALDIQIND